MCLIHTFWCSVWDIFNVSVKHFRALSVRYEHMGEDPLLVTHEMLGIWILNVSGSKSNISLWVSQKLPAHVFAVGHKVPRQREIWPSQVGRTYLSLLAAVVHDQKALLQHHIFYFLRQVLLNSTSTSTTRGGFLLSTPTPSLPVNFVFCSHYGEFLDSSISYPRTTASKFIL